MLKKILFIGMFASIWGIYNVSALRNFEVLTGSVSNNNDAYIVEANIVIKDLINNASYSTKTNEDGEYSILLVPSIYEIDVKKAGYCPLIRVPFELKSNEKLNINLNLLVCETESIVVIAEEKAKSGFISQYRIPYKKDDLIIDKKMALIGTAQIQYGKKNFLNNKLNYEEILLTSNTKSPVYLSYNTTQVYAASITLESSNTFVAKGNVIFEDGKNRCEFDEVKFSLKEGQYKILSSKNKIV